MSGEHFILSNGTFCFAHQALAECSEAIKEEELEGISPDLPYERETIGDCLKLFAELTKEMAYDAAGDKALDKGFIRRKFEEIETEITNYLENAEVLYDRA